MKGILEYDLPEDGEEFRLALNGSNYWLVLWDLDQKLRACVKYESYDKDNIKTPADMAEHIREFLHDTMDEHRVSIDDAS